MRSRFVIPAAILVAAAYVKGRQDAQVVAPGPVSVPGPSDESILRAQAEAADAWEIGLDGAAEAVAPRLAQAETAAAVAFAPVEEAPTEVAFAPDLDEQEPDFEDEPFAVEDEPVLVEDEPVAIDEAPAPPPVWIPDFDAVPASAPTVFSPREPAWEPDPVTLAEWTGVPAGPAPQVEVSGRFALGGSAVQAGHMALCGVTFPARLAGEVAAGRVRLVPDALQNVSAGGLLVLADGGFAPDAEGFTILVAADGPGPFAASGRYELIAGSAG